MIIQYRKKLGKIPLKTFVKRENNVNFDKKNIFDYLSIEKKWLKFSMEMKCKNISGIERKNSRYSDSVLISRNYNLIAS